MIEQIHPMLIFWALRPYAGVGVSRIEFESKSMDVICPACGRRYEAEKSLENAKLHIAGRGGSWPDILNTTTPIFHERVVEEIAKEKLVGYIAHPAEIVEIENSKLASQPPPRYYLIEVLGKVDLDETETKEFWDGICHHCFNLKPKKGGGYVFQPKREVPVLETWNGGDFVRTRNWRTALVYCTKRFIDLASKNKWTNFRFGDGNAMARVGMWANTKGTDAVSYLDPNWFEKATAKAKARNPDLFGISKEEAAHLAEKRMPQQAVPSDMSPHAAPVLSYEERLLNPQWDVLEKHFGVPMPKVLKEFYAAPAKVQQTEFRLKIKNKIEDAYYVNVDRFHPLDKDAIYESDDNEPDLLSIASDAAEGEFFFDPRESALEVIMLVDYADYYETGLSLEEFLKAPRLPQIDG